MSQSAASSSLEAVAMKTEEARPEEVSHFWIFVIGSLAGVAVAFLVVMAAEYLSLGYKVAASNLRRC